jgi:hypothetical protein
MSRIWSDSLGENGKKKIFTAEDTENAEKKMAQTNHMKFGFAEPASDLERGLSEVKHSA